MNGGLRLVKGTDWQVAFLVLLYWAGSIFVTFLFFKLVETRFEILRSRLFRREKPAAAVA